MKTLDVHLLDVVTHLHSPNYGTENFTRILYSMRTHTLAHFEIMPGADAEFEDQYSVILSALFDIHRHNPLNP